MVRNGSAPRQRNRLTWERYDRIANRWLPRARIVHPHPSLRFAATTLAGARCGSSALGICRGAARKGGPYRPQSRRSRRTRRSRGGGRGTGARRGEPGRHDTPRTQIVWSGGTWPYQVRLSRVPSDPGLTHVPPHSWPVAVYPMPICAAPHSAVRVVLARRSVSLGIPAREAQRARPTETERRLCVLTRARMAVGTFAAAVPSRRWDETGAWDRRSGPEDRSSRFRPSVAREPVSVPSPGLFTEPVCEVEASWTRRRRSVGCGVPVGARWMEHDPPM